MGKPSGYTLFINEEFRRRQRAGENVNKPALFKECGPKWESLPQEVRDRYKDRAKNGNAGPPISRESSSQQNSAVRHDQQSSLTPKTDGRTMKIDIDLLDTKPEFKHDVKEEIAIMDCKQGVKRDSSQLELWETDEERAKKRARQGFAVPNWKNIKNSAQPDVERYSDYNLLKLREQCNSIILTKGDTIVSYPMYTFSVNVLCKHKENKTFIPLEIGIYAYSIEKGRLGEPYHVMIDPGPIPNLHYLASKDHSVNHKIKIDGGYPKGARKDYAKIYKQMMKYVRGGDRTILIADERDLAQVRGSIQWLYENSSFLEGTLPGPGTWTILPLVEYVASATNFVHQKLLHKEKAIFALHYFLKLQLETSTWDYDEDLMCPYHARLASPSKWCARNCAIRAINCLESQLEDIYKMYKLATKPPPQPQQPHPQPQTMQAHLALPPHTSVPNGYPIPPTSQNHQMPRLHGHHNFDSYAPLPGLMQAPRPRLIPSYSHAGNKVITATTICQTNLAPIIEPAMLAIEGPSGNPLDPRLKKSNNSQAPAPASTPAPVKAHDNGDQQQ